MDIEKWIKSRLKPLFDFLSHVTIPGFRKRSVYHVGRFFFRSLLDDDLMLRASSLAFNFFLALFPALIFVFTLIAYIPIDNFQTELIGRFETLFPYNVYEVLLTTITDIVKNQNLSMLSFGFIFAIYFSSNAFNSMLIAFNKYVSEEDKRKWLSARWRSIWLTFLVTSIILTLIVILIYVNYSLSWINEKEWFSATLYTWLLQILQYVSMLGLIYFIYSALFFFGSAKVAEWKFFSPGSTLATILSVIATAGFSFYVNNFDSYNKLYGSIGTILALMVLIYFNCIVLLIGFELNSSIDMVEEPIPEI